MHVGRPGNSGRADGFSLIELLATVVVVGVLLALLGAAAGDARRHAGLGQSVANLKRFGVGTFAHAADKDDEYPTFWWSETRGHSDYADLESQRLLGGTASAAAQAVDIIRRRGVDADMPPIGGWLAHVGYPHLVLMDYLGEELPARWAISPGDEARLEWVAGGDPPGDPPYDRRWVYSSSYQTPMTYSAPEELPDAPPHSSRVYQGGSPHTHYFIGPQAIFTPRRLHTIAFPSEKVMMHSTVGWFFGPRAAYFMYPEARVPILAADGSVAVRATSDSNVGWRAQSPGFDGGSVIHYLPSDWEPRTLSGDDSDELLGRYRWTRGGALGRDFGGEEIDTGQR